MAVVAEAAGCEEEECCGEVEEERRRVVRALQLGR